MLTKWINENKHYTSILQDCYWNVVNEILKQPETGKNLRSS